MMVPQWGTHQTVHLPGQLPQHEYLKVSWAAPGVGGRSPVTGTGAVGQLSCGLWVDVGLEGLGLKPRPGSGGGEPWVYTSLISPSNIPSVRKWNLWAGSTPNRMSPLSSRHRTSPPTPRLWLTTPPGMGRKPSSSPAGERREAPVYPRCRGGLCARRWEHVEVSNKKWGRRGVFAHCWFPPIPLDEPDLPCLSFPPVLRQAPAR